MQLTDKDGNVYGWNGLEITGPDGKPKTIDQGLTSVGLSMPSAFTVSNSPLTSNGTIGVTGAGTNLEYIDGTGALRTFPSLSGYVTAVTASSPLSSSGGTTPNITISQASGTDDGYLSSTDWLTFNNKQPAGNYITALSGEATGSGPGTASVTLNNASVTAKVLTGVNITGGSISASDSILTAFGKLQNQINGLIGSSVYQGTWNASTNTPALASGVGTRGYYYIVNVAGSTNLDGITDWNVGDWAIFDGTAWQQVDNTDSVTSVNGQTGAVSLTTDNIPEGATNLYFTQLRARQSITLTTSGSSGASTYNNSTGALNIPNYTLSGLGGVPSSRRLEINGISYDLSADRSWSVGTVTSIATSGPLTGGTITGSGTIGITQASATDDGYLSSTDWNTFNNKQNAITLTTTGTSGAATLIGSTLNIPQYQSVITNPVTGTGAANYVARWTSSSNIGTGILYDTGSLVGVNTTAPSKTLDVFGDVRFQSANSRIDFTTGYNGLGDLPAGVLLSTWATANNNLAIIPSAQGTAGSKVVLGAYNGSTWKSMVQFENVSSGDPNLILAANGGNVGISTSTPSYKLEVQGNTFINDYLFIANGSSLRFTTNNIYIRPEVSGGSWADLAFYTDNTEKVRITRAGSVGIGNSSPGYKLDVAGNFRATNGIVNEANHNNTRFDNILPAAVNGSGAGTVQMAWWVSEPGISWNNGGFGYNVTNDGVSPYGFSRINASLGQAYMRFDASGFLYFYNTNTSGTRFETMTLSDAGAIRFNQYGSGTKTGTRAYDLAVDSSGNLIEVPVGSGTVTGSGTANYVARWTSASNISTGVLYDNGTNVGIGTASPTAALQIASTNGLTLGANAGNIGTLQLTTTSQGSPVSGRLLFGTDISGWQFRIARNAGGSITDLFTIEDNGYVGIGTTSPAEKLDVVGNLRLQNSSLGATIYFGSGAGDYLGYYNSDSYYRTVGSHYFEGAGFYKGMWNSIGQLGIGNTNPTQLVDIGISGAQKSLRVRGTYNFDGSYLSSATSNGGAKIEFVAHTGVSTSSSYRIQHDRNQTPDLIFSYAGSAAAYSSLSYSELMRLDPNANLGLGTSAMTVINGYRTFTMDAPSGTFTEYRQNTVNHMRIGADGGRPFIYCESPNPLDFYTSGAFSMRLAANGNLGLGTTNPTAKLHVWNGKIEVTGYPSIGNPFTFLESNYNDQSAVAIRFLNYNPSNGVDSDLGIQLMNTGGSMFDAMIIKGSTGNLGIGTNTPSQKLEVNGNIKLSSTVGQTSAPSYIWLGNDFSNGATRDKLKIYLYNSGTEQYGFSVGSNADVQYHSNGIHDFYIANSNAVRINSNGHVGIGTTAPSQKLSVIGNVYANGGFIGYRLDGGTGLEVNGGDMGPGTFIAKFNDYNNTSRVVINGVGDVGIGTTNPTKYMSSTETLMSIVNSNVASLYLYSTTGHLYNMSSISNGDLFWYDVSAGSERMRLTGSGNFGIGTSNPTVKLEVAGQAFVDKFQYNQGIQISSADLNGVTTAGFYAGSGMANAPNAGWFWVTVERHSDAGWVHQVATSYGAGNTENEIYSRTKINGNTWMPWKKIAYSSDVPTATSVYDLLPNARVDFNWVGQVVNGAWVDIFTRANNVLTSGTWMVNMYVSDYATGGAHYQYTYSGTFTWYQGGTNQNGTPAASEIALHRMGHAANNTVLYLRTTEEAAADGGNGRFQISGNYSHFANTTINFKFVKII
jgi:hypothetical protein